MTSKGCSLAVPSAGRSCCMRLYLEVNLHLMVHQCRHVNSRTHDWHASDTLTSVRLYTRTRVSLQHY